MINLFNKYYLMWLMGLSIVTVSGCGGGGGGGSAPAVDTTVKNPGSTANAGADQNVTTGHIVSLNGSASIDSNGNRLRYSWEFDSIPPGSKAALSSKASPKTSFIADLDGSYVVHLIVNDGKSDSLADTVTITAATGNSAPVANAGTDQNVMTGTLVALSGSGSSDANGDVLTYSWSFESLPQGSGAALSSSTVANPSFVPDRDGSYIVRLVANDGVVDGIVDTVTITSSTGNSAPMASAGPDQSVVLGAQVALDGSGSSDANGDPLTYAWSFVSMPTGSKAALSSPSLANPTFSTDLSGDYVLSLVVNDGTVSSIADTVMVSVSNALILDGVGDRAESNVSVFPTSGNAESFTVEAWIYPTAAGAVIAADDAYNLILFRQDGEANLGVGIKFSLYTSCSTPVDHVEFRDVTLNQWNHVAAMYGVAEGKIWLSINGAVSVSPTPVSTVTLCNDPYYHFTVGGFYNLVTNTFAGKIDDVRVSKGARYTQSFTSLPLPTPDVNTVSLWSFNETQDSNLFASEGASRLPLKALGDARLGAE